MDTTSWDGWGLGGLIFVGLEMRQNYEIALGNQHQGRTELRAALLM